MSLPPYAVDFRGLPACPCQVEWIPELEIELRRRGLIQGNLAIAQMIGLYEKSGNTHGDPAGAGLRKGGGVTDFWLTGRTADKCVAVMRQMGADPTWHRGPGWDGAGGSEHVHCGLRGCLHRTASALDQEWAVDHNGDGLVGDAPDPGPRPLSDRTWRQGIEWAHQQQEEADMQLSDKLYPNRDDSPTVGEVLRRVDRFIDRQDARSKRTLQAIDELPAGATKAEVRRVVAAVLAADAADES